MFFVVFFLSLVGSTLTSSLSKRGGGHNAPLINCPTCEHHVCDLHNLIQCEVCEIHIPHENQPKVDVKCVQAGHCHEDNHHHCCDNEGCVAHYFGQHVPSAVTQTANPTSTGGHQTNQTNQLLNHIPCPVCTHHKCDVTNTDLCEVCQITFEHQLPRQTNCLTVDHHCNDEDKHICCTDMACVENVFGNIPKSGASLNGNKIYCPECTLHNCNFIHCETCVYHGFVHGTQLHDFKTCELKGECSKEGFICCHDYPCIDKLFGTHFQITPTIQSTSNPSITSKTTDRTSTSDAHALSHATNESPTSTAATMTTTVGQRTTQDTTTPIIASSVSSNGQPSHYASTHMTSTTRHQSTAPPTTGSSPNGQPTHYASSSATSMYPTSTTAPTTTASSPNGTNSCVDELNNCAMFKSMGVCHASPQERTKYDIAFQCKLTCDRCNETYEPLTTVASTIPTTIRTTQAPIHCQVCGDYDSNIPCDLVSVYKGSFISCPEGAYCMTDVVHEQGNVKTFKRCVNETVCRNLWMSQTSDQDHCTNYGNVMVSGDYSCHYCCTTDRCNRGLIPDPSTYYIKA